MEYVWIDIHLFFVFLWMNEWRTNERKIERTNEASERASERTNEWMITGKEKAHAPTGIRTQNLSHSDHWSTKPHGILWQIGRINLWLDSSSNLLGTDAVRQSLCCSQPEHEPTLSYQMPQERKKHMARPGLEPRTSRIPCEHSNHWATEPHGRPVTDWSRMNGRIIERMNFGRMNKRTITWIVHVQFENKWIGELINVRARETYEL